MGNEPVNIQIKNRNRRKRKDRERKSRDNRYSDNLRDRWITGILLIDQRKTYVQWKRQHYSDEFKKVTDIAKKEDTEGLKQMLNLHPSRTSS